MSKKMNKQLIAGTLSLAMLVSGTLAWQSFSQIATNETNGIEADQGTRLHNYFDGSNADVFVENYARFETGATAYTRVKVLEYMEIGDTAGYLTGRNESGLTQVRGDVENYVTPDINNPETWDTYLHDSNTGATGAIRDYLTVSYGDANNANKGQAVYMPTFNKDFESLDPDIIGKVEGNTGDRFTTDQYNDYDTYSIGETVTAHATYSADSSVAQAEGSTSVEETHEAVNTLSGSVITMDEWLLLPEADQTGDFWVYDTDGWAYWANGIAPETATSILIDNVSRVKTPDTDWYYGLHVINDSATADSWLDEIMLDGQEISDNAIELLRALEIEAPDLEIYGVSILTAGNGIPGDSYKETTVGGSITFNGAVSNNYSVNKFQEIDWTISEVDTSTFSLGSLFSTGNASTLTDDEISATLVDGVFKPVSKMEGYSYEITATSVKKPSESESVVVNVIDTSAAASITVTSVGIRTANGNVLSASDKELFFGDSLSLSATVYTDQGVNEFQSVTWSISSSATNVPQANLDNTLVAGVFTPIREMEGNTYTIKATSVFDTTKSTSETITVKKSIEAEKEEIEQELGEPLEIQKVYIRNSVGNIPTASQKSTTVGSNINLQQEVVTNFGTDEYQDVTWTIKATSGSALTAVVNASLVEGVFTPVDGMDGGTYDVTATSKYDTTKSDTITLTVEEIPSGVTYAVESVAITTITAGVPSESYKQTELGGSISLSATVYTTVGYKEYQDMTWSIVEKGQSTSIAAINATMVNGTFTPVSGMAGKTYTVTATSKEDISKSDSVDLTVIDSTNVSNYEISSIVLRDYSYLTFTSYTRVTGVGNEFVINPVVTASDSRDPKLTWAITSTDETLTQAQLDATLKGGIFTAVTGMEGKSYTITVGSLLDEEISASVVISVANLTQETIDAASIEINFDTAYNEPTSTVKQGDSAMFIATVTGLGTSTNSYVNWYVEGNNSPETVIENFAGFTGRVGKLKVSVDETVGSVLKITAISSVINTIISVNTIELIVAKVEGEIVAIPGTVGNLVVGTASTVVVDDVEFYAIDAKDTTGDGKNDQVLLYTVATVNDLSADLIAGTGNPSGAQLVYYHNRTTKSVLWEESYMRTDIIPGWLKNKPTISSLAIETEIVTDGYYTTNEQVLASGEYDTETTLDKVFVLSQDEFVKSFYKDGMWDKVISTSQGATWTRSPATAANVRYIKSGNTFANGGATSVVTGVRFALWVSL